MVLTDAAVAALRDLAWQLEAAEAVVRIPRYPLYVADDRRRSSTPALRNCEPWGWPNRPGFSFAKALDWELPLWRGDSPTRHAARTGRASSSSTSTPTSSRHWSHRLHGVGAHAAQAARVGGLPRARRRRQPPAGVCRCRRRRAGT